MSLFGEKQLVYMDWFGSLFSEDSVKMDTT